MAAVEICFVMCRLVVVAGGTMCQGREHSYHGEHGDNAQPVAAVTTKDLFGSLLTPLRRSPSSHHCVKVGGCWWLEVVAGLGLAPG